MAWASASAPGFDGVLVATPDMQVRERVFRKLDRRTSVHVASGAEALAKLEGGGWQVLFLDRRLPDLDAEELGRIIERRYPGIRVVMLDSGADDDVAGAGVWNVGGMLADVPSAANLRKKEQLLPNMVGSSEAMRELSRLVRLVAPRSTTVLITGPTGSGKELVARAIHQLSPRAGNNFSVLNCAAIPETLVESELFGFARGAFTGAMQQYGGRILAAQGGTLFLDEIGELPLNAQSKLLRFLEAKEVQRLGSSETVRVDVRVVAATNRNIPELVERGKFREDLFYRLSTFPVEVPALIARQEDIPELAKHFLAQQGSCRLLESAEQKLRAHRWPGNIRELQQVVERAVILAGDEGAIGPEHLRFSRPGSAGLRREDRRRS